MNTCGIPGYDILWYDDSRFYGLSILTILDEILAVI